MPERTCDILLSQLGAENARVYLKSALDGTISYLFRRGQMSVPLYAQVIANEITEIINSYMKEFNARTSRGGGFGEHEMQMYMTRFANAIHRYSPPDSP